MRPARRSSTTTSKSRAGFDAARTPRRRSGCACSLAGSGASSELPAAAAAAAPALDRAADSSVALEIKDLRRLLETQLASFAWNDLNRQAPVRARLLRELAKLGVDSTLAAELADEVPPTANYQEAMRLVVRRFGERLPLVTWDMADDGGVFAIVGPTGVGKTTSIAKIAARFVLRHSVEELGLVSTDTYRIGARQQLANFARILRAPMHVAENAADMRRVLDSFAEQEARAHRHGGHEPARRAPRQSIHDAEGRRATRFARCWRCRPAPIAPVSPRRCKVFQAANPEALIVTKLDEAAALGGVLSLAISSGLPVAYLSDGQRVPEDLHRAAPKRFWLLHNALKLSANGAVAPDEHELAERFGHMELAANG